MLTKLIKKITILSLVVAVVSITAVPFVAFAKNDNSEGNKYGINKNFFKKNEFKENKKNNIFPAGLAGFDNSAFITARDEYRQSIQDINSAYKDDRKTAHEKLASALSASGSDFTQRLAAYKTYLNDLLVAFRQKADAKETAMQKYIDALSGVQTNQAPTANAQSVNTNKNVSVAITLTGSDTEASALSFFVVTNPSHGTLSGTVPNLTYLPSTDFEGSDSFTFKVNDGSQDSASATVSITINP